MSGAPQHNGNVEVLEPEVSMSPENAVSVTPSPPRNDASADAIPDKEYNPKDVLGGDKSVYSLLRSCPRIQAAIKELESSNPEMLTWDEVTFKSRHRDLITLVTQRVRTSLWLEFENAIANNRLMRAKQIFGGVCGETTFYSLIENPVRLAYILCAPADYVVMLKEAHVAGLEKMREILSANVVDEDGFLNPKAADIVLKTFALLDARLKGAIVQRVDQRTLTANLTPQQTSQALGLPTDMTELEKQLADVQKKLGALTQLPRHPDAGELDNTPKEIELQVKDVGLGAKVL